ncbi:ArsR/SmtB family transcription factor [Halomarina litorea]|uniref:ArsR/SmtB family transcription factor n=1 Tax=Halomarina litorea TaxID=2961595 RepID=UPI0020C20E5C|nr:helix-turn-helix domain-containing protein [Halomarina sp. BCD28]
MTDGEHLEDAFSLLANETRLRIIEAIGDASGGGEYAVLSHRTLRDALGVRDTGNLNYHLRQLRDRFVERVDEGYQLTIPGIRVYQAILSGSFGPDHHQVPPAPVDEECLRCAERMCVRYEGARYYLGCEACGWTHTRYPLPPNAFDPEDPESLWLAGRRQAQCALRTFVSGICPYCSGPVRSDFIDESHTEGLNDDTFAHLECTHCHWYHHTPMVSLALHYPVVRTFHERRGVSTDPYPGVFDGDAECEVLSRDPWRVAVTYDLADDSLRVVVDGTLDVVDRFFSEHVSSI